MKKRIAKYAFLVLFLATSCEALISFNPKPVDDKLSDRKDKAILNSILTVLTGDHYKPVPINDDFSSKMFDLYIDKLDYKKRFLTQGDYDKLEKYRYKLDDEIKERKFDFFELSHSIIQERIEFASTFYDKILGSQIKLENDNRFLQLDPDSLTFVNNKKELKHRWRDYMIHNVFSDMYNKQRSQEKAHEKSDTVTLKSLKELELNARDQVRKTHEEWFKRLNRIDRNDRLSTYFNCITELFDPHTNFYPPKDKEDFDISMSGKLEGIGATLQEKEGYIKVTRIVTGSASWKQGELEAGDLILKVGQGTEEPVDVVDMRLDEAVRLIRGPKGSEVRLTVRKIDGNETVVPIVRDVVVLEETYAKSAIIQREGTGTKTGYIYLPKFYADFQDSNGRRCSEDVKKEVKKLMDDNVDGIVIDLRNNGGGSLRDVVDIGGLFVKKGPIVQVKGRQGAPYVLEDKDPKLVYAGPLVIMINQFSASASEILAAAMQDYGRAIIIGSQSSYGKGTVQRFETLDRYLPRNQGELMPLGSIKYTMQKFYRINGGATQLRGVESDVELPNFYKYINTGEREMKHAMPWDEIKKANYQDYSTYVGDFKKIVENSNARIKNDSVLQLYEEGAKYYEASKNDLKYSLTYNTFKLAEDKERKLGDKYEKISGNYPEMAVSALSLDSEAWGSDTSKTASFNEFKKKIGKDAYINEATRVIEDIIAY